jgi:hypothetical protein
MNLKELENEIKKIKERNVRVEIDKAWETSKTRKLLIILLTYAIISIFFIFIKIENPFSNAIVPTLGFFLSTLALPFVKNFWIKKVYKK